MTSAKWTVLLMAVATAVVSGQTAPGATEPADLAGIWTLNRALSQFHEVGFGMDAIPSGDAVAMGNRNPLTSRPLSEAESRNMRQLLQDIRNPSAHLTIAHAPEAVTVSDDHAVSRTFRADGRERPQPFEAGPMTATATWEGGRLVVRYKVAPGREIRQSYWRKTDPPQLIVQAELLERGGHDTVVRVYEPAKPGEPLPIRKPDTPPAPSWRSAAVPASEPDAPPLPTAPTGAPDRQVPAAGGGAASAPFDQTPGAEFKGLTTLGIVVEGLGSQAASCGVRQQDLEAAVSKPLADAGLKVVLNADEDTYLYINVITAVTSTGYCFSRYDAHLSTHTTATLSYGARPVLVQVSLLNKGGIAGSAPAGHGEAVAKSLGDYVAQFAARIRDANK